MLALDDAAWLRAGHQVDAGEEGKVGVVHVAIVVEVGIGVVVGVTDGGQPGVAEDPEVGEVAHPVPVEIAWALGQSDLRLMWKRR